MAQNVALAKAPVPVLGKGRMVWDLAIQTEPAKPAIGEIEMNLLAQTALRPYAHAIADDQHADHQLRIDRGATGVAVERLQRLTDVIEVEMPVDASQYVIGRDVIVEAEIIDQPGRRRLNAHHRRIPRQIARSSESRHRRCINQLATFSTVSAQSGRRYRQRSLECAAALARAPARPRDLKGAIPDAPKILLHNVYGWFVRVERGVYLLSEARRAAIILWKANLPEPPADTPDEP